ncbi:hypothetical protein QN277_008994 [Acacia crassicarpa]|uniref:Uncharacterized protein n=1 Tax=Acacia crassicarpa TaxID=499986 RepID=A0AAE1ISR9_9FABA|nr:hypothetical protein QN277_008994 [Acacia crassicarpa]
MTSNDSVDEENILKAAKDGKWRKVFKMYEEKKDLRTIKTPSTGDTVLHMAVSSADWYIVAWIVDLVCLKRSNEQEVDENGDEKKQVFGAVNKKGNTPLHLAASASNGSFEMCKKVGGADRSIITTGYNDGETPLFLAALHGNKEAFLWLHYKIPQDSSSRHAHYKRDDNDTILHCAIAGGHIDVGIEIVHLYGQHLKEMTMTRNKNGLSPLHILAATPSAFESIDLPSRFFVVRLLYRFFRVKEKQQASAEGELKQPEWKLFEDPVSILEIMNLVLIFSWACLKHHLIEKLARRLPSCFAPIWRLIVFPLAVLVWILGALQIIPTIFLLVGTPIQCAHI